MTSDTLTITDNRTGKTYEAKISDGTIRSMDLRQIKEQDTDFGLMGYDPAFTNTASCRSAVTFIDGGKGILRYRGYPIEQLAESSTFLETSYLLIYGSLPSAAELDAFEARIKRHTMLHEDLRRFFDGFPRDAHPMPVLSSAVSALSTFYQDSLDPFDAEQVEMSTVRLLAKVPTIAAYAYKKSVGQPFLYPDNRLDLIENFIVYEEEKAGLIKASGLIEADLPAAGWRPLAYGVCTGLTLLVAFGLPPVLQLARVPPLRVIRRDVGKPQAASLGVMGAGLLGFSLLLMAVSRDLVLGLWVVLGFAGAVAFFAALSWLAVRSLRWAVNEARSPQWLSLATRQISARPIFAMVQVSALSVGLLALVLLVLLRTDLVASWRNATPADAPNRFVLNVQPDQSQAFQDHLRQAKVQRYDWYPMIRARLVAVNGQAVAAQNYSDERAKRLVDREFNVSHSVAAPAHNSIVAGAWLPEEPDALSLEEGLAKTLGLKMGDRLRFDMAGVAIDARVTSIRRVDWTSMRANFFAILTPAALAEAPQTWMTAFYLPPEAHAPHKS